MYAAGWAKQDGSREVFLGSAVPGMHIRTQPEIIVLLTDSRTSLRNSSPSPRQTGTTPKHQQTQPTHSSPSPSQWIHGRERRPKSFTATTKTTTRGTNTQTPTMPTATCCSACLCLGVIPVGKSARRGLCLEVICGGTSSRILGQTETEGLLMRNLKLARPLSCWEVCIMVLGRIRRVRGIAWCILCSCVAGFIVKR